MGRNIAVIDSGTGGLSVLKELKKRLPQEDYVYYADIKNMPYGKKTDEQLKKIAVEIVLQLKSKFDVKLFVLACNTLTAAAVDFLRQKFSDSLFVGVEPNVKQALACCDGKILVLATPYSATSERVRDRLQNKRTVFVGVDGLAELIEYGASDDEIIGRVKEAMAGVTDFEAVVLGCTHYSLKKDLFRDYFCCPVFDGNDGVAKRVEFLLCKYGLKESQNTPFIVSNVDFLQKMQYAQKKI